jgi:hypothetical protein
MLYPGVGFAVGVSLGVLGLYLSEIGFHGGNSPRLCGDDATLFHPRRGFEAAGVVRCGLRAGSRRKPSATPEAFGSLLKSVLREGESTSGIAAPNTPLPLVLKGVDFSHPYLATGHTRNCCSSIFPELEIERLVAETVLPVLRP